MTTAEATLCREQEIRRAEERPAIAWHEHPAWTVWAERRTEFPKVRPPAAITPRRILECMGRQLVVCRV
jgi:hypothetical protein